MLLQILSKSCINLLENPIQFTQGDEDDEKKEASISRVSNIYHVAFIVLLCMFG